MTIRIQLTWGRDGGTVLLGEYLSSIDKRFSAVNRMFLSIAGILTLFHKPNKASSICK